MVAYVGPARFLVKSECEDHCTTRLERVFEESFDCRPVVQCRIMREIEPQKIVGRRIPM